VLAHNGLQRTAGIFQQDHALATQAEAPAITRATATPEGVQFSADWGSLLGVGEMVAAALLLIGLATRLVALPILAILGYAMFADLPDASLPTNTTAMWLLAVACLSLLVSGSGSLAVHRRRCAPTPPPQSKEFVHARPPVTQRVSDWFTRWRPTHRPVERTAPTTARWWKWGRC
jgi:uncharacterized membrane protein YphA (DoxX/SURF4 family)